VTQNEPDPHRADADEAARPAEAPSPSARTQPRQRRFLPWLPFAIFLSGSVFFTIRTVQQVRAYQETDAKIVGVVYPGNKRPRLPRELYEITLPDGRLVQAYGGVVGQSAPVGAHKRVYFDPEAEYAAAYEQSDGGEPNTAPVFTTLVSAIFVPTVLWATTLAVFGVSKLIIGLRREELTAADAPRES
jgi:hypothetical protein